jgi:hypothetical protein
MRDNRRRNMKRAGMWSLAFIYTGTVLNQHKRRRKSFVEWENFRYSVQKVALADDRGAMLSPCLPVAQRVEGKEESFALSLTGSSSLLFS